MKIVEKQFLNSGTRQELCKKKDNPQIYRENGLNNLEKNLINLENRDFL